MKINYDYKTYEDRLRERYIAFNNAIEKKATSGILNSAIDLFDTQQYDLCLMISEELKKTATNSKDLYDAKKMIALCHYAKQDLEKSEEAFTDLAQDSNNSDDWFNLVISAALNKNLEKSENSFGIALEKFTEFGTEKNMPSVLLIFHYMLTLYEVEAYELAFDKFNLLRQVYEQIKKTDEKLLVSRGLNPINVFLEGSRNLLEKVEKKNVLESLNQLKENLDKKGFNEVEKFIETL